MVAAIEEGMITSADILKSKILIVDDLRANISLLKSILTRAGYVSVASTLDSSKACELHRVNHYDLILLDLEMPNVNGFEVMEGLKEIEAGGTLPVLVVTVRPEEMRNALRAGAVDFVSKPFDIGDLLRRVRALLEVRLFTSAREKPAPS
jgi:DNA-binding response OmpR family regulator